MVDLGTGAEFRNNTMGGFGNRAFVGTGIVVMGMQNATVQGNATDFSVDPVHPVNNCPQEAIAYEFDPYAIGRNLQQPARQRSYRDPNSTGGCIGHPVQATP